MAEGFFVTDFDNRLIYKSAPCRGVHQVGNGFEKDLTSCIRFLTYDGTES